MLSGCAIAAIAALWPAWASATDKEDSEAATQIATALRDSGKMHDYSIGVKYKEGTAWLAGRVTTNEQLTTALQIVSNLDGVDQIINHVTVAPATEGQKSLQNPSSPSRKQSARGVKLASASTPAPLSVAAAQSMPQADGRAVPAGYRSLGRKPAQAYCPAAPPVAGGGGSGRPLPAFVPGTGGGVAAAAYDQPHMPNYSWPSYAAYPNYAALTYPRQYSPTAWPFIGPFYPYPQVPMGWRKVSLEWDDGWWFLDFHDRSNY
jgi:hypothetical protein